MKKFLKWLGQRPFIKGFLRFYMASESDITSIAVAYYLLISILPFIVDCSQYPSLLPDSSDSDFANLA